MIDDPAAYRWFGCTSHCGVADVLITPHPSYLALGSSPTERARAYRDLLNEVLSKDAIRDIRTYLQQQRALGRSEFQAMVEAKTRRFARVRPAHRPRKPTAS